ncbi:MAG: monoterpene epsilon-lactone hydrolase [Paracoccaceae bacterium]
MTARISPKKYGKRLNAAAPDRTAPSLRMRAMSLMMRVIARPKLTRLTTPVDAARQFERTARRVFRRPPYMCHLTESGTPILQWLSVGKCHARRVVLYLHGGAYVVGNGTSHSGMLGRLSKLTGLRVAAPDYRLLKDAPFPAAFEDAVAAWDHLIARGYDPENIVLGGDSAGGGLMFALLAHLTERGTSPACAFAFSPWTDLTLSGESMQAIAKTEVLLPVERMGEAVQLYLDGARADDPRISPLFARYVAPPPVLIQVGSGEALLDDARRMAAHLRDAGGACQLDIWEDAPHVWQIMDGWIPEARAALRDTAAFVQTSLDNANR